MSLFKVNPNTNNPVEKRRLEYASRNRKENGEPLLVWENDTYTVDEANIICSAYINEGNSKADDLKIIIASAKDYIRSLYPDEE